MRISLLRLANILVAAGFGFTFTAGPAGSSAHASAEQTRNQSNSGTARQSARYRPPTDLRQAGKAWTKKGQWWVVQNPSDPTSPRFASGQTGPKYGVNNHADTIGAITKYFGVQIAKRPQITRIDEWQELDGSDFRIAFAETRLGGRDAVAFIMIKKPRNSEVFQLNVVEMSRETFIEWGGAARMMVLRGLVPNMDAFPRERRRLIANGSMIEQAEFYRAAASKYYELTSLQTLSVSQNNLLLGMQELNYDLLFDNDIGTSVVDF